MTASKPAVCPIVGTTNTTLPPSHPPLSPTTGPQTCPVTNATTAHHALLAPHPGLAGTGTTGGGAQACPALREDAAICPVVGPVSAVLPPNHPVPGRAAADDADNAAQVCPVTKATLGHHLGKVVGHPALEKVEGVCPVVGKKAEA